MPNNMRMPASPRPPRVIAVIVAAANIASLIFSLLLLLLSFILLPVIVVSLHSSAGVKNTDWPMATIRHPETLLLIASLHLHLVIPILNILLG